MIQYSAIVSEDSTTALLARIRDPNTGDYTTVSSVSSVQIVVKNTTTNELVRTYSPTKTDIIKTPLVTGDNRWVDSVGYNIIVMAAGSDIPEPADYEVVAIITPVEGTAYSIPWKLKVTPTSAD